MATPQSKLLLGVVAGIMSATAAGTATSAAIDTFPKHRFVSIDVSASTQSASTQAGSPSVLKLQESDSTAATTFVDIIGFRGGSAAATNIDFIVGVGVTANGGTNGVNAYKFNVDTHARKRYLSVVISPTTTQTFYVQANGFESPESPSTATKAGVLSLIEG